MASGLTLIFSMMGVLNFAHASFYMLGAFFGFQISQIVGFWPAFVVAPVLVGGIGALVERYGLRHVHQHGPVAELLFTFGLAFVIEEVVQMIWGKGPADYRVPPCRSVSWCKGRCRLMLLFSCRTPRSPRQMASRLYRRTSSIASA